MKEYISIPRNIRYGEPVYVKTYAWLDKLKNHCKGNEQLYNQLL